MVTAGAGKARLRAQDMLVRGALSGALLGFATTLAQQEEDATAAATPRPGA
jgi:uncharacterized membrane protein